MREDRRFWLHIKKWVVEKVRAEGRGGRGGGGGYSLMGGGGVKLRRKRGERENILGGGEWGVAERPIV
jgi:hypothetical protein